MLHRLLVPICLLQACFPDFSVLGDPNIACTENTQCPGGYTCRLTVQSCVRSDNRDEDAGQNANPQ